MTTRGEVSGLLLELGRGDPGAMERLLPLVYDELHVLARRHRYRWPRHEAPGTTSLVHEAYLKLVDQSRVDWQNGRQFFYLASRAMRSILVDNARHHHRQKRGGEHTHVPVESVDLVSRERAEEILVLADALERLQAHDEELARIVDCRVFGGLTLPELAEATGLSLATVKRRWSLARAWLYREMGSGDGEAGPGESRAASRPRLE